MRRGGGRRLGCEGAITCWAHYTENQFGTGLGGPNNKGGPQTTPSSEILHKMTLNLLSLISYLLSLISYLLSHISYLLSLIFYLLSYFILRWLLYTKK
jgi:hypothetical protein